MSKQQARTVLDLVDPKRITGRDLMGNHYVDSIAVPVVPLDYATDSYESRIIDNADIIESYYLKYAEKVKLAPEQCKEYLAQELGMKLIELMERQ